MEIIFIIFSTFLVLSSLCVVLSNNPVHSVLFLIFSFFNAAVIFLLSNAEFLAMTILIVYVGAVAVLFLFVVMMLNINIVKVKEGFLKYFPFGLILVAIFLSELSVAFGDWSPVNPYNPKIDINTLFSDGNSNTKSLGLFLYTDYFIIFQISAYVLLVAMIGAIVLAFEKNENTKKQDVFIQGNVDKKKIIKLNDIHINKE